VNGEGVSAKFGNLKPQAVHFVQYVAEQGGIGCGELDSFLEKGLFVWQWAGFPGPRGIVRTSTRSLAAC
jgi:hypothetical protein